jgi:hypothetical protein
LSLRLLLDDELQLLRIDRKIPSDYAANPSRRFERPAKAEKMRRGDASGTWQLHQSHHMLFRRRSKLGEIADSAQIVHHGAQLSTDSAPHRELDEFR